MAKGRGSRLEKAAEATAILAALRSGEEVKDKDFDTLIPAAAREFSRLHWTSVGIAKQAAALLVDRPGVRVLDLGSGVGKFCMVGASTTVGHFTGVELNPGLVRMAKAAALKHKINNVSFIAGDMLDLDWRPWDAYYLFNPFASAFAATKHGFRSQRIEGETHERLAAACRMRLADARIGARVVLYWGYGESMAPGWRLTAVENLGHERLELWVKEK